jgi:hypothetical protein
VLTKEQLSFYESASSMKKVDQFHLLTADEKSEGGNVLGKVACTV